MASHADADLILKLYDLRREAECRKARAWLAGWKPADAGEVGDVAGGRNAQCNAWLRQATSYWEMAFSLVNSGAVDEALFAKNCGEGILFCVKCRHLGERFGEAFTRRMPEAEAFIARNAAAQAKAELFRQRLSA
jgi:hypothetical protein